MNPDSPLSEDEDARESSSGRDKFRRERDDSPSPNRDGNGYIPLGRMREGHGPMIPYDLPPQAMIPKGYVPPPPGPGGLLPTPVGPMGPGIPGGMDPGMDPYERSRSPERWVRDRYSSRSPPRRYDYHSSYRRYEGDRRRDYDDRERDRIEYYRRERDWERDWERERDWDRERERERYRDRRDEYGRRFEEKPFHPRDADDRTPPYKRRRDEWDRRPSSMSPPPGFHSGGPPPPSYRPPRSIRDMNHLYEGPLKTFKQFGETQDEYTQPGELEKRFEEYQQEYKRRQAMVFFNEHKNEEWFLEKYHPHQVEKARTQQAEQSRTNAASFFEELAEGNLSFSLTSPDGEIANPQPTEAAVTTTTTTNGSEDHENAEGEQGALLDEEEGLIKQQQQPEDTTTTIAVPSALVAKTGLLAGPDGNLLFSNTGPSMFGKTLFVKTVPPQWSKAALLELMGSVKDCPIVKAIFSEPNRFKGFHRLAWVSYETEAQAQKVLAEINGKKLHDQEVLLGLNKPMTLASEKPRKPRITTPVTSTEDRLLVDLRQAQALTRKMDEERGVVGNPLLGKEFEERTLTTAERLDFFLVYLRQVHFYCYYCAEEFDDIDDLFRNCGAAHVRSNKQGVFAGTSIEREWVTNLDNKINKRISDPSELTSPIGKDLAERIVDEFCDRQTKLIEEGKFACGLCQKLFKGPQFVKKHIHLKHPEEVDKMKDKALEEQYFLNYFDDPRRILPSNMLLGLASSQNPLPLPHPQKLPAPSALPPGAQQHLLQQHKQGQVVSLSALVSAQAAAALAGLAAAQQTLSLPPAPLPTSFGRGPGVPGRFPPGRGHPGHAYNGTPQPIPDRTMNFDRGGSFPDRGGDRGRGIVNWRGRGDYIPRGGPRGGRGGYHSGNPPLLPHPPGQDPYQSFRYAPPYRSSAPYPHIPPGQSLDPRGDERRLLDYVDLDAPSEGPTLDYRSI